MIGERCVEHFFHRSIVVIPIGKIAKVLILLGFIKLPIGSKTRPKKLLERLIRGTDSHNEKLRTLKG